MIKASVSNGFTIVELMVVVAMLGIIVGLAVPNFTQFIRNNHVQAKADELANLLQYARSQAVTERVPYEVNLTNWEIKPQNGAVERKMEINSAQAAIATSTNSALVFDTQGRANASVAFIVCNNNKADSGFAMVVELSGMLSRFARGKKTSNAALTSCSTFPL